MLIAITLLAIGAVGLVGLWATGFWLLPMTLFAVIFGHAAAFYGIMVLYVAIDLWRRRRDRKYVASKGYTLDMREVERWRAERNRARFAPWPPHHAPTGTGRVQDTRTPEERNAAYLAQRVPTVHADVDTFWRPSPRPGGRPTRRQEAVFAATPRPTPKDDLPF